jgi:putative endonuclease
MKKIGYVYILASDRNGTLYIGVTSNLIKRIDQHKQKEVDGFTMKYSISKLVWYEQHDTIESAILREKQMKKWKRLWKLREIEEMNSGWEDLSDDF